MQTIILFNFKGQNLIKKINSLILKNFTIVFIEDEKKLFYYIEEFEPKYLIINCYNNYYNNSYYNFSKILTFIKAKPFLKSIILQSEASIESNKSNESNNSCDDENNNFNNFYNFFSEKQNIIFINKKLVEGDFIKLLNVIGNLSNNLKLKDEYQNGFFKILNASTSNNYKFINQQVIAFYSVQGGIGRTTLAINLALSLKSIINDVNILFLDLNFGEGSSDLSLKLNHYQFNNLGIFIDRISDLPQSFYQSISNFKDFNIDIIFPPITLLKSDSFSIEMLNELILNARKEYNFIIVDLPNRFDNIFLEMLNLSTIIFLISSPQESQISRINDLTKILPVFPKKLLVLNNRENFKLSLKRMNNFKIISKLPIAGLIPQIQQKDNYLKIENRNTEIIDITNYLKNIIDNII